MTIEKWSDNSGYTRVEFYPNGEYKGFVPTTETEWSIHGKIIVLKPETQVRFHENGVLREFTVLNQCELDAFGKTVVAATSSKVELHLNGRLRRITLGTIRGGLFNRPRKWKYEGQSLDAGTTIAFKLNGQITKIE